MRLGGPERGIQAGLVDGAVDERRRRAGGRERPPGERREPLGLGLVEAALEREDVAVEPGQQVEPGAEPGVRELRQVRVQVDHPGHDDPGTEVERAIERDVGRSIGSGAGVR